MGRRIGIDFGSTYSCVSYVDENGLIRIIDSIEGASKTPSIVYFDPDSNEAVVGATARLAGMFHPEYIFERVRRYMDDPSYPFDTHWQEYSPVAISSLILQKLIRDAESWLRGEEIEGAVITCPAYFGGVGHNAIRVASENVVLSNGQPLKVLQVLSEPVAAALAYGHARQEDMQKQVMIYDLGGSTFDCTVMKISSHGVDRKMEIVTIGGSHQLGGKDWDDALANYVINKFCDATGYIPDEILTDPEQIYWYRENIERAKILLTQKEVVKLTPSFNGHKEPIEVTREIFDEETEHLLELTILLVEDTLHSHNLTMADDIDEIILVGGSTKMPQVEKRLQMEYNKPIISYEPDKVVAMGAALVASQIVVSSK